MMPPPPPPPPPRGGARARGSRPPPPAPPPAAVGGSSQPQPPPPNLSSGVAGVAGTTSSSPPQLHKRHAPAAGSSLRGSPSAAAAAPTSGGNAGFSYSSATPSYPDYSLGASYSQSSTRQQEQQQQPLRSSWSNDAAATSAATPTNSDNDQSALVRTPAYFLVPSLLFLLFLVDSMLPLQVAMLAFLVLYGLDLSNASRTAFLYALVGAVAVLGIVQGYACFLEPQQPRFAAILQALLAAETWTAAAAALALSSVPWLTLSSSSSALGQGRKQWTATARRLQSLLHGLLPPLFASLATSAALASDDVVEENADDLKALVMPHLFAAFLAFSMLTLARSSGSAAAEFGSSDATATNTNPPVLSPQVARVHAGLLLLTPPAMHLVSCWGRIGSTLDDVYNLVLVSTVPLLLYQGVCALQYVSGTNGSSSSKAATYQKLLPNVAVGVLTLVASVALQQRYLLSLSHSFAYRFFGTKPNVVLSTIYWFSSTAFFLLSLALWGRTSATGVEGEVQPVFGEFQEDIVQLGLALAGMCLGKAFGLSWNFVPLPVLACLGLVLWMTTRMLRYLVIFLFVGHATGVVVFTYRFAGIDETVSVVQLVKLSLMQFAFVVVVSSVLVGLIAGLSIRSAGGFGAKLLRRFDVTGLLLVAYTVLLVALEVTLLKKSEAPMEDELLSSASEASASATGGNTLYHPSLAMFTSMILVGLASFLKRVNVISARSAATVTALSIGKAVSIYIDAHQQDTSGGDDEDSATGLNVFVRALVAALLALVMFAPRVFLEPVHVKTFSRRMNLSSGRRGSDIPQGALRAAMLYAFVFLPLALVVAIPYVLIPLAGVVSDKFQDDFYSSVIGMSSASRVWHLPELVGCSLALWGLACVSMLNYYLPDAGGEAWKKLSALAFLVGTGIFFAAPMLGMSSAAVRAAHNNPYAAMSSLGSQLIRRRRSRTGGWGLLAAAIATLLAVAGPLELKERPATTSGQRDRLLLLRTMLFSLLFGGGVAWFVVMQTMREADFIELVIVTIACLVIASMGTVCAVLGYFLALEEFDDAVQVTRVWLVVLVIFLPFAWSSRMFVSQSMHLFGPGGWLSTYLSVSCLTALAIAVSLRMRSVKNTTTSSLGNFICIFSWACAIALLYGRFGVAGLDANYDVRTMFWVPASVAGTLIVSPILLALEGEASSRRQSAVRKLSTSQRPSGTAVFGMNLASLTRSNRWAPLFFGTALVFLLASLYAILLRGSGLLSVAGGPAVSRSHEDVHLNVFSTNNEQEMEDFPDLATLAAKAISQSQALVASAKLAGSGIWTAKHIFGPLLHLGGVAATLPSLYLLYKRSWVGKAVPTAQVTLALPLNAIPLLLCRGLPSLQAAAIMGLVGGIIQLMILRRADQESMMRI